MSDLVYSLDMVERDREICSSYSEFGVIERIRGIIIPTIDQNYERFSVGTAVRYRGETYTISDIHKMFEEVRREGIVIARVHAGIEVTILRTINDSYVYGLHDHYRIPIPADHTATMSSIQNNSPVLNISASNDGKIEVKEIQPEDDDLEGKIEYNPINSLEVL